ILFFWMNFPLLEGMSHQGSPHTMQSTGHQNPPAAGTPSTMHQGQDHQGMTPSMNHGGNQTASPDSPQNRRLLERFTSATGYIALGLLGLTLLIGPANLLLHRRTPISSYLARDVGMWAAFFSVMHVIAGIFVHGPPAPFVERIRFYF